MWCSLYREFLLGMLFPSMFRCPLIFFSQALGAIILFLFLGDWGHTYWV